MGHPVFISANTPVAQLKERVASYLEALSHSDYTGTPDIAVRIPVYVAETTQRAHDEPEASAMGAIQYAARELAPTAANPEIAERLQRMANMPYSEVLRDRVVFGTPEEVVEKFKGFQENFGATGVVMEVNYGGELPYDRVKNSLRLLSEKVMPAFK